MCAETNQQLPVESSTAGQLTVSGSLAAAASPETVFARVLSPTAFEETVDRLGTAIKLGLLPPGTRLPAERELCMRLGVARATLNKALVALSQSGYLYARRGAGGGTFVVDPLPPSAPPSLDALRNWRDTCDRRMVVEVGVVVLAAKRADDGALDALDQLAEGTAELIGDLLAYRQADIRFHVGLAEATGIPSMVGAMTDVQAAVTELIERLPHSPELLESSNQQHRRLIETLKARDQSAAATAMIDHLHGTEHILAGLAGLLPER